MVHGRLRTKRRVFIIALLSLFSAMQLLVDISPCLNGGYATKGFAIITP